MIRCHFQFLFSMFLVNERNICLGKGRTICDFVIVRAFKTTSAIKGCDSNFEVFFFFNFSMIYEKIMYVKLLVIVILVFNRYHST